MNFRWEICSNLKTNIMFLFTFYSNTIFQVSRAMYKADTHSLMLLVDNANFVLRFSSGSGAVADLHSRRASPPPPVQILFQFHAIVGKFWQYNLKAWCPQILDPPLLCIVLLEQENITKRETVCGGLA